MSECAWKLMFRLPAQLALAVPQGRWGARHGYPCRHQCTVDVAGDLATSTAPTVEALFLQTDDFCHVIARGHVLMAVDSVLFKPEGARIPDKWRTLASASPIKSIALKVEVAAVKVSA